jgi:hypothetical protein
MARWSSALFLAQELAEKNEKGGGVEEEVAADGEEEKRG